MAKPNSIPFGAGKFYIEDAANAGTWVGPCGFTSGSMSLDPKTKSTTEPDCADPDAPAWETLLVESMSWNMKFKGVLDAGSYLIFEDAAFEARAVNIRWVLKGAGTGAGTPDKRYSGSAILKIEYSAERAGKYEVALEVMGSGALTRESIAAV